MWRRLPRTSSISPSSSLWLKSLNLLSKQGLIMIRSEVSIFQIFLSVAWAKFWSLAALTSHYCRVCLAGYQPLGLGDGQIMCIQCWSLWNKERWLMGWSVHFISITYNTQTPPNTFSLPRAYNYGRIIISLETPKGAPLQTVHVQQCLLTLLGEESACDLV